jgi:tether containing UBX domain for GLUT4
MRQVCSKVKEPVAGHTLTFQNKKVDLSLSLRFANIPNNAKLELVIETSGAKVANVQIVLQLPDGQRVQKIVPNSSNFWSTLRSICPGTDLTRQWCVML